LPQTAFLFSVAGLSFTLVGFSGLIAALNRDGRRPPLMLYRLRQIPEMAVASALIALITIPLADSSGSPATAIRVAGGLAFAFTVVHAGFLLRRVRSQSLALGRRVEVIVVLVDTALLATAIVTVVTGQLSTYEWLLVLLVTRPALAFVMALSEINPS
jgi:hypothetical protein